MNRRDFLLKYSGLPVGPLEQAERLEQLRALENGHSIRVVETEYESLGVDTPAGLERVSQLFEASLESVMGSLGMESREGRSHSRIADQPTPAMPSGTSGQQRGVRQSFGVVFPLRHAPCAFRIVARVVISIQPRQANGIDIACRIAYPSAGCIGRQRCGGTRSIS